MTTETLGFTLFVALSLTSICLEAASMPKSGTDQYASRHHDQSHPVLSFDEAFKAIQSKHRFDVVRSKEPFDKDYPSNNDIVPDLQVGCGDGLLVESTTTKPVIPKHKRVFPKKETRKKREIDDRNARSYFSYTVRTPSSVFSVWRPQLYKTERPYFIPLLGAKGRVPIYFPPQPVFVNPGFPQDNPPVSYNPPNREYLPASTTTSTTEMPGLADRFGMPDPIWGMRPVDGTSSTTARPNTSTFPPLVHNTDPHQRPANPIRTTTQRPTITIPPPPVPPANDIAQSPPSGDRGASQPQPNRCAWAIINCCSAGSRTVSQSCFERLGCPGPFWDRSPCEGDFAREAIEYALNFYQ